MLGNYLDYKDARMILYSKYLSYNYDYNYALWQYINSEVNDMKVDSYLLYLAFFSSVIRRRCS